MEGVGVYLLLSTTYIRSEILRHGKVIVMSNKVDGPDGRSKRFRGMWGRQFQENGKGNIGGDKLCW